MHHVRRHDASLGPLQIPPSIFFICAASDANTYALGKRASSPPQSSLSAGPSGLSASVGPVLLCRRLHSSRTKSTVILFSCPSHLSPSRSRTMMPSVVISPKESPPSSTTPVSLLMDALLTSSSTTPSSSTLPASHSVLTRVGSSFPGRFSIPPCGHTVFPVE